MTFIERQYFFLGASPTMLEYMYDEPHFLVWQI